MLLRFIRWLLFIVGVVLAVDGLVLFALKKINFGTVMPFLIGVIFLLHSLYWQRIQSMLASRRRLKMIWKALWVLFVLWLISFAVFLVALQRQINTAATVPPVKAIIILGAGVVEGRPTAALANRLDSAVPIIRSQPQAVVITSGGIDFARQVSEADIMAKYLHDQHNIPLQRIQTEGQSTSTEENLELSKAILSANHIQLNAPIAIVTNGFHTIRAKAIAERQGYKNIITVASETPLSIRFNAWFREYFAFISGWLLDEY